MDVLAEFRSAPLEAMQVVWVVGELDLSNVGSLEAEMRAAREVEPAPDAVVVDLSGVLYVDSSAVRALIEQARSGTPTRLVAPQGSAAHRTLTILGIDTFIPLFDSLALAVR